MDRKNTVITTAKDQILSELYLALSCVIEEFHVDIRSFYQGLINFHIKRLSHIDGHKSILRLALHTGIDRRIVSIILKGHMPTIKHSPLPLIFERMQQLSAHKCGRINKKGTHSIEGIMHHITPGATTVKTIVDELVDIGAIKDNGTDVSILRNPYQLSKQQQTKLKKLSKQWLKSLNCTNQLRGKK